MRKIDKLINLQRANLLIEQRYLNNKGLITEISQGLKNQALKGATDKLKYMKYNKNIENPKEYSAKKQRQIGEFSKVNPELTKTATDIANTWSRHLNLANDPLIAKINRVGTDETSLSFSDRDRKNLFKLKILGHTINFDRESTIDTNDIPPIIIPQIKRLIKLIQSDLKADSSSPDTDYNS